MDKSLADFTNTTSGMMEYLKNQLTAFGLWNNITGSLQKVSSSSAGFVWGYNSGGKVFYCKEPCSTSSWTQIPFAETPSDIATDSTQVYILYSDSTGAPMIASTSIDGSSDWTFNTVPFNADKITTTNGFLWASGAGKMGYCGKPCNTDNWNVLDDNHSLLSGGGTSVFASSPGVSGVFKTDETAQTGWSPVGGFSGISPSVLAAESDNTVLYAADNTKVYRCESNCDTKDKLEVVNAQGFVPIQSKGSMTVNPSTRNVWMASESSGKGGNLFARLDTINIEPVMDTVYSAETQRDRTFNSLGDAFKVQTAEVSSKMAQVEAADAVKQAMDISGDGKNIDNEIKILERKIEQASRASEGYKDKMKPLMTLLIALVLTALLFIIAGWLLPSSLMMGLAILILGSGLGLSIYFSVNK
jgi:hypothetical protein